MNALLSLIAVLAIVLVSPDGMAHSVEDVEATLRDRERYVEIVSRPAPAFTLKDAGGKSVSLADFRGKVVVLQFIYAGCPDVCPVHAELIAEIQGMVNRTPMRDMVAFVTITTDPGRDTPEVLRDYGTAHGLDKANWMFLTSGAESPEVTRKLARQYGLEFTEAPDGMQMHGVVTHVIDRSGSLRARYHGLKFSPTNIVVHINALTNDHHHTPARTGSFWQTILNLF